jgi:hypothetical protein
LAVFLKAADSPFEIFHG